MNKDIEKLKSWLSLPGNGQAQLAAELGYQSSMTIRNWILRGRIPLNRIEQVRGIINGGKKKTGFGGKK